MATLHIPCLACRAGTPADEAAAAVSCATCGTALPPPAQAAWLMTRDGKQQYGPYTLAQLAAYIAERRILPGDGIWYQGASVRLNAGQLPLAGGAAPAGAPAPTAPPVPVPAAPPVPVPAAPAVAQTAPVAAATPVGPIHAAHASQGNRVRLHVSRALNWDLRSLPVEPGEEEKLLANGVDEADARRYLVWRRSVLLVVAVLTLLSALLKLFSVASDDYTNITELGVLLAYAGLAPLFAMPLTAWLAARVWDRHRRSRTILTWGWLFAFLMPLLLGLVPFGWRFDLSGAASPTDLSNATAALGLVGGMAVYVTLMPAVLSLIPGVLRGCLRIKALIPESILPGLFLVAATPLYILLFLVIFTTVNQVAGNALLIFGVLALLGAPLLYLINARLFTRPLRDPEDIARIGSIQNKVLVTMGIGLALIVAYAFTVEIFNQSLIGTNENTSFLRPWSPSLIQFPIDYFVRSMFTMVLVADLFMLMNLQLWRHTKEFQASPDAASYDRLMVEIEEAGGAPQPTVQAAPTA